MKLSLVIPVWNDPDGLARLLEQVAALGLFQQVIVADDASDPAATPGGFGDLLTRAAPETLHLRSPVQRGAGHARNAGLERVTGSHVLFFDSDDLFTPGIATLLPALAGRDFDFAIFRHVDSRVRAAGGDGPLASDDRIWTEAGVAGAAPARLSPAALQTLCRITAYPWNKIYRTGFLRDHGIRCTEIPVHNDVELHWMSFFKARRVLASSTVACEHVFHPAGTRLTNRSGAERLQVFQALRNLQAALDTSPRRLAFIDPFTTFCLRLFGWIDDTLDPGLRARFRTEARAFLLEALTEPLFTLLALRNPALGARITRLLSGGAAA